MAIALAIIGFAFAAFCVWLGVRIINRRERWAKWTLATIVALTYPASIGPWYYVASRIGFDSPAVERTGWLYVPLLTADAYLLPECAATPYHEYFAWCAHQGLLARYRDEWKAPARD
jgi:hypothetical protein